MGMERQVTKATYTLAEPGKYTVSAAMPTEAVLAKPNYSITFYRDGGEQVGELDFNGPSMVFRGNAEESAQLFFRWIAEAFKGRLAEERKAQQPKEP